MGAIESAKRGLIVPVLVGPEAKIRAVAAEANVDLTPFRIVGTPHSHAAAERAVAMARAGEVDSLMKGSLHTDELMEAVVSAATGLRTERRISHVFVMDVPAYPRPLLITDAAINIAPDLDAKADICRNAIDLAHVLGIELPKIAILSAAETVNAKIESTLHAAALCKMADRGQITGGILDGPLAFDNAISPEAARTKGIVSAVAGMADILLVPDLESGNMIAKQLTYLAGADSAGVVLGARVPIVLTSRADNVRTRLASAAVLLLVAHDRRREAVAQGMSGSATPAAAKYHGRQRKVSTAKDAQDVNTTATTRIEKDAMGEVRVDGARLWGAQTQRSVDNFPIGVGRFSWGRPVVRAFGIVKQAAARANAELGELPSDKADLIEPGRAGSHRWVRWTTNFRWSSSRPDRGRNRT